jgi:phospholipid-binding lipoprotein MlaA
MILTCAPDARAETPDPLEGLNRKVLAFNDTADRFVLKPVAKGYRAVTPKPVRRSIGNFFSNLFTPLTAINQLLQGKVGQSGQDTMRFLVNTTLGVGGLFDVSSKVGLPQHDEDFDQTFARWGIGSGPYLVLPFFGPSTVRGGIGSMCGAAINPIRYLDDPSWRYALSGLYFVDTRSQLLDVEQLVGGDRYTFLKDAYLQRRAFLINDGAATEDPFLEDFGDEDENFDDSGPDDGPPQ